MSEYVANWVPPEQRTLPRIVASRRKVGYAYDWHNRLWQVDIKQLTPYPGKGWQCCYDDRQAARILTEIAKEDAQGPR